MKKVLLILLVIGASWLTASASAITALSCSETDIASAWDQAAGNADPVGIVIVPSGTCIWGSGQAFTRTTSKPMYMWAAGVGSGKTIIVDNTGNVVTLQIYSQNYLVDLAGFQFEYCYQNLDCPQGSSSVGTKSQPFIQVSAPSSIHRWMGNPNGTVRIHHNHLQVAAGAPARGIAISGLAGLIDWNQFDYKFTGTCPGVGCPSMQWISSTGDDTGNGLGIRAWQDATLGISNPAQLVVVEYNTLNGCYDSDTAGPTTEVVGNCNPESGVDGFAGVKYLIRNNWFNEEDLGFHGFDSGIFRSVLLAEITGNFYRKNCQTSHTNCGLAFESVGGSRGGISIVHDNVYYGKYADFSGFRLWLYRAQFNNNSSGGVGDGLCGAGLPTPLQMNYKWESNSLSHVIAVNPGTTDWAPTTFYAANATVTTAKGVYLLTNGPGTSGGSTPAWYDLLNVNGWSTVNDGSLIWRAMLGDGVAPGTWMNCHSHQDAFCQTSQNCTDQGFTSEACDIPVDPGVNQCRDSIGRGPNQALIGTYVYNETFCPAGTGPWTQANNNGCTQYSTSSLNGPLLVRGTGLPTTAVTYLVDYFDSPPGPGKPLTTYIPMGAHPLSFSSINLWAGILDPAHATDWTIAGVEGGVPFRSVIYQTLTPADCDQVTGDCIFAINDTLNKAGADTVVQLGPGDFPLQPAKQLWSATTTYPKGAIVFYVGHDMYSLQDNNLNHAPTAFGSFGTYWMYHTLFVPTHKVLRGSGAQTGGSRVMLRGGENSQVRLGAVPGGVINGNYLIQGHDYSPQTMIAGGATTLGSACNNGAGPSLSQNSNCFKVSSTSLFTPGANNPDGSVQHGWLMMSMLDDGSTYEDGGIVPVHPENGAAYATATGSSGLADYSDNGEGRYWYNVYATLWVANTAQTLNKYIQSNGYIYQVQNCNLDCKTGAVKPFAVPVTGVNPAIGSLIVDNNVTWKTISIDTRVQGQTSRIVAVDRTNNVVVVHPPLYTDYPLWREPHAWGYGAASWAGIENIQFYYDRENIGNAAVTSVQASGGLATFGVTYNWGSDQFLPGKNLYVAGFTNATQFNNKNCTITASTPTTVTVNNAICSFIDQALTNDTAEAQVQSSPTTGYVEACDNCWVTGIQDNYGDYLHWGIVLGLHVSFNDNNLSNDYRHNSGAGDMDLALQSKTSASLVQNNIFDRLHVDVMYEWGISGNVVAYNFGTGSFHRTPTNLTPSLDNHGPHPQFTLQEGNLVSAAGDDGGHGSFANETNLRNWFRGATKTCLPVGWDNLGGTKRRPINCTPFGSAPWTSKDMFTGNGNHSWFPFAANVAYGRAMQSAFTNSVANVVGSEDQRIVSYACDTPGCVGTPIATVSRIWALCDANDPLIDRNHCANNATVTHVTTTTTKATVTLNYTGALGPDQFVPGKTILFSRLSAATQLNKSNGYSFVISTVAGNVITFANYPGHLFTVQDVSDNGNVGISVSSYNMGYAYRFGFDGTSTDQGGSKEDSLDGPWKTLMVYKDYDYIADKAGDVQQGIWSKDAATNPPIPPSFYLRSRPSFWPADLGWPSIGSDLLDGDTNYRGHLRYKVVAGKRCYIPAQCLYYAQGGGDGGEGSPINYNPAAYYAGGGGMSPGASAGALMTVTFSKTINSSPTLFKYHGVRP